MASRSCVKLDDVVISNGFLDSFDFVLTDCDGVLWMGDEAIPGSVETLQALKKMGKQIVYVTNNSTKSREEYLKKCLRLGFPATLESIVSTSFCAAAYLQSLKFQKKAYIIGSQGITDELDKVKIQYLPIGPDPVVDNWIEWVLKLELESEVGAVIVGFDQYISFPKLTKAASYLKKPETIFLVTNRDEKFPTSDDNVIPGTGAFVAAVEAVSGRKGTALGKPERFMLDCVKMLYPNIDFARAIMIGDRLNTDILLGTQHGLRTLLVETGINTIQDVRLLEKSTDSNDQSLVPDYYLPRLGDLLPFLKT